jgi:hypothetical protein
MFRKLFFTFWILCSLLVGTVVFAQQELPSDVQEQVLATEQVPLKAVAGKDRNVLVGRQLIFNGEQSSGNDIIEYSWDLGDGTLMKGVDISHTYEFSGVYRVVLNVKSSSGETSSDSIFVNVAKDIVVLVTDDSVSDEQIQNLQYRALADGVVIVPIVGLRNQSDFLAQKEFATKILEAHDDIIRAKSIILWTEDQLGSNSFLDSYQSLDPEQTQTLFSNKLIVNITDSTVGSSSRVSKRLFNVLKPQHILIAPPDSVDYVVTILEPASLFQRLHQERIPYQLVGIHSLRDLEEVGVHNFLSAGVNYLVNNGVPLRNIFMILIIPIIATFIALVRQVIGLKSFGLYTPTIITLSFMSIGWKYGLAFFAVMWAVGTLTRLVARRSRLMYIPRMAILLIMISFAVIGTFYLAIQYGYTLITGVSILPVLILSLLAENFIAAQMERGTLQAARLTVETIILALGAYYIATLSVVQDVLLAFPELVLVTLLVNFILGRWTGLRLLEYSRFNRLFIESYDIEE